MRQATISCSESFSYVPQLACGRAVRRVKRRELTDLGFRLATGGVSAVSPGPDLPVWHEVVRSCGRPFFSSPLLIPSTPVVLDMAACARVTCCWKLSSCRPVPSCDLLSLPHSHSCASAPPPPAAPYVLSFYQRGDLSSQSPVTSSPWALTGNQGRSLTSRPTLGLTLAPNSSFLSHWGRAQYFVL